MLVSSRHERQTSRFAGFAHVQYGDNHPTFLFFLKKSHNLLDFSTFNIEGMLKLWKWFILWKLKKHEKSG
jgi:hypothetical protein